MSSINPKKLKVLELRRELEQRNISVTKSMKKADLTALLMSAIESEVGQEKDFSSSEAMDDSATSGAEGDSQIDQTQSDQAAEHSDLETAEEAVPDQEICKSPSSITPNIETAVDDKESVLAEKPENEEKNEEIFKEDVQMKSSSQVASSESTIVKVEDVSMTSQERQSEVKVPVVEESSGDVVVTEEKSEVKIESADHQSVEDEARETIPDGSEENIKKDAEETEETSEVKIESTDHQSIEDEAKETIPDDGERNIKREGKSHHQDPSRKRKHTEKSDRHNISDIGYTPPEEEPDEEFDDSLVVLDTYNSDLNFKVSRDRLSGQPLTMEGFAYLWGGARATYGIKSGKACFECKILEEDAVKHLPSDEPHPHVVRVGWSTDYSSLQLGEDAFSYGYGGTGKFSADCKFSDFGETFKEGDVIGCYIDFSQENQVQLAFTKNGEFQGVAFTGEKDKLQNQSLFPHVLCKNTGIELNFGLRETAHFPHPEELQDYIFISSVPSSERERAVKGPQSKKECEVLMMCGLPGAGKTHYCQQIMKEEPDKKYNVLGTNSIMMKMRVMGIARKKNYASRWEQLIDNATQCLSRLLQVACRKRRNYILDQTNVYASAQRRKMRPFEGFQRKAIVIVPTEEEYKMRFEKRTDDEGKEVPEMAILGMKANFILPEEGNIFDEIIFTELSREEAQKLVEKYREEGKKHGPPPEKRFRAGGENRNRNRDPGWRRGRGFRGPMPYSNDAPWGRFGGGQIGFARGGFASAGFNRGGGFRGRPSGFGARGKDFGRGGRRDNSSRKTERGGSKGKGGWQDHGGRGNRGGYGGYNRQNQGRGGFRNSGSGNSFQGRQNQPNPGNRMSQSAQSVAPQSAQSYTYGHHPQYNTSPSVTAYNSGGYNNQQQKPQAVIPVAQHGQAQQGYQQAYGQQAGQQAGQQDYSQQWAQFYQQQAQAQQYQNYYANYQQQYYNQQSAQQQRP